MHRHSYFGCQMLGRNAVYQLGGLTARPALLLPVLLLIPLVLIHFFIGCPDQIRNQIIVVAVAHLISNGIADRMFGTLIVLINEFLQFTVHPVQLLQRRMFLNNDKLIASINPRSQKSAHIPSG